MIVGLLIALFGALAGIIGSLVLPWVDTDVVKFDLPALYQGYNWGPGLVATILLAVAMLIIIAAFVSKRHRKTMVTVAMVTTAAALIFAFLTPFSIRDAVIEMIKAGSIPKTTTLAMFYGFHAIFVGSIVMMFGCAWVLGSAGAYKAEDKLLRVAHLWHGRIIRETTITERKDIRIGGDAKCDFVVPLSADPESDESITLFKPTHNDNFKLTLAANMHGRLNIQHKLKNVQDTINDNKGAKDIAIDKGDWGTLDFGFNQIFFNFVHPDVIIGRGGASKTHEGTFLAAMVAAGFVCIAMWIASQFIWDPAGNIERHKSVRKVMKVEAAISQEKDEILLDLGEEEEDVGKKAEGEEGKFGDPDDEPDKENKVPKRDGAMAAKIDVKNIGLADLLSNKLGKDGAISSILSDNTDAFENRMAVAMAGTGSELVVGYGAGGMGFRGTGSGGGGTGGYGRIHGLGRVDTGGGMGMRAGLGSKKGRKVGEIKISGGGSQGFCQKGNIEAVVKQRAGAIRACYESELQLRDDLSGKVVIRWTIDPEGRVDGASVTNSTMSNEKVERCMMTVIRRMRFQKPDSGICIVQWPFVFSPG